jgi:hypothetical protein
MDPTIVLDALVEPPPPPSSRPGVAGHNVIQATMPDGRGLVVMAGTAVPEYRVNDTDNVHTCACVVKLREQGDSMEQSTVHVGLASISNDDTDWVLADDSAQVRVDPATRELELVVNLAAFGGASILHRFSYQVVVVNKPTPTEIAGTLTWQTASFRPPSTDPVALDPGFRITANRIAASGALIPFAFGSIAELQIGEQTCQAIYTIPNPPVSTQLTVIVECPVLSPLVMDAVPTGSNSVLLTPLAPTRTDVNFVAARNPNPS